MKWIYLHANGCKINVSWISEQNRTYDERIQHINTHLQTIKTHKKKQILPRYKHKLYRYNLSSEMI